MNIQITCRGCSRSAELDSYIHEQLKRIENYLDGTRSPISLEMVIEQHKTHPHNRVTLRLHAPMFHFLEAHEGVDLYATINHVSDVMYKRILENKQELVDEKRRRTKL